MATVSIEAPPSTRSLAEIIQEAQDDPAIASVHVIGGGSLTEPIMIRKYTTFDSGTYSCDHTIVTTPAFIARLPKAEADVLRDLPITDYGCFLIKDGVYIGGTWRFPQAIRDLMLSTDDPVELARKMAAIPVGDGTTILEPEFSYDVLRKTVLNQPSVEVFETWGDVGYSHTGKARNVSIQGFKILGRQKVYDGGVRSTILMGNCEHCSVSHVALVDTASIGITAGGSALEFRRIDGGVNKDNFANDVLLTLNLLSGVAAANTATINTENGYVVQNYVRRTGHHEPRFGGGVCGHDHETNSPADHTRNIFIFNNFYDYEDAHQDAAGSAICVQDPYVGQKQAENNVRILNNIAVGGREADLVHRFMSNGIYLVGLRGFTIGGNYIFRTGQNAFQIYNVDGGLIEDNILDSTGGGGNPSFWSDGMRNTTVRRNPFIKRDIPINMQAGFFEKCGENNQYLDNAIPGADPNSPVTKRCP